MTEGQWWQDTPENVAADDPTLVPPGAATGSVFGVGTPQPPFAPQQPQYAPDNQPTTAYTPPAAGYAPPTAAFPATPPPPAPPGGAGYQQPGMPYAPPPPPTSRKRRSIPWKKAAVGSTVAVALLAGSWVVYDFATAGGASSPEEAVQTLLDGATQQDPLLAASVMNPGELPLLTDLLTELGAAQSRVGVGSADKPIGGTKVEISDLSLEAEELAPSVSRVTIKSGELKASVDKDGLPEAARNALVEWDEEKASWTVDVDDIESEFEEGISAIVVDVDGGWYISPTLTAADLLVSWDEAELDSPDYDAFGDAEDFDDGAEDPEGAVDLLADAISTGEVGDLVAALPSDQAQFAVVFGDALETYLGRVLDDSAAGAGRLPDGWVDLKSYDLKEEDGPDGMVRLVIDNAKVEVMTDPIDMDGDVEEVRVSGLKVCEQDDDCTTLSDDTPIGKRIDEALGGSASLLVREVDGGWKVDPVASVLDMATRLVKGVDKDLVTSATMDLGGKANQLQPATPETIRFDDAGYALVGFPTTPGTVYAVMVDAEGLGDAEAAYSTKSGGRRGSLYSSDYGSGYQLVFVADLDRTNVALGGVLNRASSAEVTMYEVPVTDQAFDTEIRGSLEGPLALHRVPVSGETDDDGYRTVNLEANAAGGDLSISLLSPDDVSPGSRFYPYGDMYVEEGDDLTESSFSVSDDVALVVITGEPGTSYAYKVAADERGFQGGVRTGTVLVPANSTITVPIDLGSGYASFFIDASWSNGMDVDAELYVDGDFMDDDYTYDTAFTLYGDGYGQAELELKNRGSLPANVNLTISFDE